MRWCMYFAMIMVNSCVFEIQLPVGESYENEFDSIDLSYIVVNPYTNSPSPNNSYLLSTPIRPYALPKSPQ